VDEKVKVGLVGAGPWAHMVHAPILANHPETELVGVWARRAEAAEELANKHKATTFADYAAMLDRCDAVAFCVPPNVQAEMAVVAAREGKTLLLEKPIALDLAAAEHLAAAVDAAGVRTVLLLSMRYAETVRSFFEQAKTIGKPLGGRVAWVSGALKHGSPFATPWRLERGPLPDLGPHALDLIDGALGPITQVKASGDPLGWVSLLCEHANGATSTVDLCATAGAASVSSVEVYGEEGSATLDASRAADATSMMRVPAALAAAHRGEATDAPDVHRGLHLQRLLHQAESQLS
jgi:predicted dehydrogenase